MRARLVLVCVMNSGIRDEQIVTWSYVVYEH